MTTEVVEYREGNMRLQNVTLQPGMQTLGEVTLKKGVLNGNDVALWNWWNKTNEGRAEFDDNNLSSAIGPRQTVTIELLNNKMSR